MRRNTKTMYEWRKVYRDKEELMSFARAIKGQRHTLRRAALSPLR